LTLSSQVIHVDGIARRFVLAAPTRPPSVIVLSLHGSRSGPEGQARLSRAESLTEHGAVVCFPQGSLPSGSGSEWDLVGDDPYLRATLSTLQAQYPTAHPQVCVTGMSGGARMASRFASMHPDQVMVLGAVAGLRAPVRPMLERPVRVLGFHGTSDRINPFAGGTTDRWDESVVEAARAWAKANGHEGEGEEHAVSPTLTQLSFGSDGDPGAVTLWVCRGAGHTWPGSKLPLFLRLFLGRTSLEVDATAEIWRAAVGSLEL